MKNRLHPRVVGVSAALVLIPALASAQSILVAGAPAGAPRAVTFTADVAPILFNKCASCHRKGEVGPFPLTTYKEAKRRGRMIRKVTKSHFMPPWHPVEGHGEFAGENRLTAVQIKTLDRWVAGGMKEGDKSVLPALPKFTKGWQLGIPDLIVSMEKGFAVPAGGPDIYRSFLVPVGLDEDKWITAIEVRPGARTVLHHVIFGIDTRGRGHSADGEDGRVGFRGRNGSQQVSTSGLGGWAVGGQPRHLPMGLARRLPKGSDIILQSHFHPSGKREVERTTLGLYFTDKKPERTMVGLQLPPRFGALAGLNIPAGESAFQLKDSFTMPVDALGLTVGGHAHYLCKEMHVILTYPGGEEDSVFFIDNWAFNWQNRYQYREPLDIPAGTKVEVFITYDNSADNPSNPSDPPKRVRWGLQSTDEMGSVTLLMVAADEADTRRLKNAIRTSANKSMRSGRGNVRGLGISMIKMLDRNGDGDITADEIPSRLRRNLKRVDTNGDGVISAAEIEAWGKR